MCAALAAMETALDEAAAGNAWSLTADEVSDLLRRHARVEARLARLGLRLASEADGRDLGQAAGAGSTGAWLRDMLRLRPGEARARVDLAHRVETDLAPLGVALEQGEVSLAHAQVVRKGMAELPVGLPGDVRDQALAFLVEQSRIHDPAAVAHLATQLLHTVDPAALERREERDVARRELWISDFGDLRGRLDAEARALLMTALDPLAAPQPAADGSPDMRSAARRRADALVDLVTRSLDGGQLPSTRRTRPHLTVTASLETLLRLPGAPAARTTWGGPLSGEALRRIACDCGVTQVLTDPAGVPLDVGREQRSVTPGIWAALVVRDIGCCFPGCTRPAEWCDAHHLVHWADGGETSLLNAGLLCGHHHRAVHHRGWDIVMAADGRPQLLPPPWVDPERQPRRNTYWDAVCGGHRAPPADDDP